MLAFFATFVLSLLSRRRHNLVHAAKNRALVPIKCVGIVGVLRNFFVPQRIGEGFDFDVNQAQYPTDRLPKFRTMVVNEYQFACRCEQCFANKI